MTLRRSLRRASVVAMITTAALLTHVSPAAAVAAGSGVTTNGYSDINETGTPEVPLCLQARTGATITLYNKGTFNGGAATLDTEAEYRASEGFYFGPDGTFSDSACLSPKAVRGKLSVTGGASCPRGATDNATYQRVGNDYVIKTTANVNCTANGTTESSALTFTGNQNPCVGPVDPCGPDGPTATEFAGEYTQTP